MMVARTELVWRATDRVTLSRPLKIWAGFECLGCIFIFIFVINYYKSTNIGRKFINLFELFKLYSSCSSCNQTLEIVKLGKPMSCQSGAAGFFLSSIMIVVEIADFKL